MDIHDKNETDGSIKRYKVCLLAKGFTQTYDINYTETNLCSNCQNQCGLDSSIIGNQP